MSNSRISAAIDSLEERPFSPFTLKLTESVLKLRLRLSKTREERKQTKQAIGQVRFLKAAYMLLFTMRLEPALTDEHRENLKQLE